MIRTQVGPFLAFAGGLLLTISTATTSPAQTANETLLSLGQEIWEFRLRQNPLFATSSGDRRFDDQLPTISEANSLTTQAVYRKFQERLRQICEDDLSATHQINFEILERFLATEIAETEFGAHLIPITNREGFHISFPDLRRRMPLKTVQDFENYIARLRGFKDYSAGHIQLMRQGLKLGLTLPSVVLQRFRDPIEIHLVKNAEDSLFYEPLKNLPVSIPQAERTRLQAAAQDAIQNSIVPGYAAFLEFMASEYVPGARGTIGASALPDGRAFYRHRVQRFTTLELSPEEVHQIGLSEVKRIRAEMQAVIVGVEFTGTLADFIKHLRNSPQFQPTSAEQLMSKTSSILKRMDGELPKLFRRLPRTPYGLKKIPDYIAPQTTSAYYMPPPGDGTRAGFYYLNTYDLKSRPLYNLQALSLHEAVPGHHLQIALQQEMADVPPYRRFASFTAFVEGWALYAERLGLEVGFYEEPYSNFGRLTFEMWRACRLVVDTGIHYFGWTRQQAINFMAENTALSLHDIRSEVDRYIAWPGQALGYKIGELKIRELRAHAEKELGDSFDIREFHDALLLQGSVPLDVLSQQIDAWIRNTQTPPHS
ncbi:MAG: DUF885 domain-containing protein [Planctomycetaceae bacterium]|nr:DUF885 domain-containing protein [Planctomycetaceae bacterium]